MVFLCRSNSLRNRISSIRDWVFLGPGTTPRKATRNPFFKYLDLNCSKFSIRRHSQFIARLNNSNYFTLLGIAEFNNCTGITTFQHLLTTIESQSSLCNFFRMTLITVVHQKRTYLGLEKLLLILNTCFRPNCESRSCKQDDRTSCLDKELLTKEIHASFFPLQ